MPLLDIQSLRGCSFTLFGSSPDNPDDAFNLVKRMGVFAYILDLLLLTPLYFIYKKMKRDKTETLIYQSEP